MKEKIPLLSYEQVLEAIKGKENHLLIGNGFNYGLGVNTSYPSIFKRMIKIKPSVYEEARAIVEECQYDLELFIGKLEDDIENNNSFLKKYVRNKVKLDFMQATHAIVKEGIKNIYAEQNEGIFILLQNFTNYFSLNYDSFLYLLLLKYKSVNDEEKNALALEPTLNFIKEDLDTKQNGIYTEIKEARDNGKLEVDMGGKDSSMKRSLKNLPKSYLVPTIAKFNNKGWKGTDVEKVVDRLLKEEKKNNTLNRVDDGSRCKQTTLFGDKFELVFDVDSMTQNLFFLHGAFHIYKDGDFMKKITQETDKALYERLEEIINDEEKDIVCVFQCENKIDAINENMYLQKCLNKIGGLAGNIVIIGSSLADNDNHIFKNINDSPIETVYISTFKKQEETFKLAKEKFPLKNIFLFDAETISYYHIEQHVKQANHA